MITCYYTEISYRWDENELTEKLKMLPEKLKTEALRKKHWLDRQLFIAGNLLLVQLLKKLKPQDELSLQNLSYTAFERPYFADAGIDFNISHSGNMVVCCGTSAGIVGIDIEHIKEINLNNYTDYFTPDEWANINNSVDKFDGFYYYWTRKEAVIKAIGHGFNIPLSQIDVRGKNVIYEGQTYYLQAQTVNERYKCHIAATVHPLSVQSLQIDL